jgi:hypothetical protein
LGSGSRWTVWTNAAIKAVDARTNRLDAVSETADARVIERGNRHVTVRFVTASDDIKVVDNTTNTAKRLIAQ